MPTPVDKYFKEVKDKNPSYSDEKAWATAWSIYCKHVNPGSDSCKRPPSEYLKGKSASDLKLVQKVASRFEKYQRSQEAELRPFVKGEVLPKLVSISEADRKAGSPREGDMIARNPENHEDQWLVAKKYFEDNFEKKI